MVRNATVSSRRRQRPQPSQQSRQEIGDKRTKQPWSKEADEIGARKMLERKNKKAAAQLAYLMGKQQTRCKTHRTRPPRTAAPSPSSSPPPSPPDSPGRKPEKTQNEPPRTNHMTRLEKGVGKKTSIPVLDPPTLR